LASFAFKIKKMTLSKIFNSVSSKEWRFVWVVGGVVVILTTLPYLYGYLVSSDYFLWSSYTNAGDVSVYLSLMEQASQGKFFLANLYTNDLAYSLMVQPFWLFLGLLVKLSHLPKIFIYQAARIIFGFWLLAFLYLFLAYFIKDIWQRKIGFLLLAFGSGIGAFLHPLFIEFGSRLTGLEIINQISADLFLPELNIFVNIFHSPLLPAALLVELLIFYLFINSNLKLNHWLTSGLFLLVLFLGFFHPYDLITVFFVCSFFVLTLWCFRLLTKQKIADLKPLLLRLGIIFSAFGVVFIYYLILFRFDPFFPVWNQTNFTESPPFFRLLTGYGLIFVFALAGICFWPKKNDWKFVFLLSWLFINLFLAYLPFSQQRRVLSTVFIPLVILATLGAVKFLDLFFSRIKAKAIPYLIVVFLFLILALSNISVLASNLIFYQRHDSAFYFPASFYQAALWLKAKPPSTILATPKVANPLPAITGDRVYIGHLHQTVNYDQKLAGLKWFFENNEIDNQKEAWLAAQKIDFIFYTKYEKSLGDFQPAQKSYLKLVYQNPEVEIYQVYPVRNPE